MEIFNGNKIKISENESCFYCGSTNTITYEHENRLMFEIQCNCCHENSIY